MQKAVIHAGDIFSDVQISNTNFEAASQYVQKTISSHNISKAALQTSGMVALPGCIDSPKTHYLTIKKLVSPSREEESVEGVALEVEDVDSEH